MGFPNTLFYLYFFLLIFTTKGYVEAEASSSSSQHIHKHQRHEELCRLKGAANNKKMKLFVFGDSYADTGNMRKSLGNSWKQPYGITFPGKPAGRFSDGRVLTDYLAKFLGLKSPVAYRWMNFGGKKLENGMNFAYGGSGVFNTLNILPNMSIQIDFFEQLLNKSVYTKLDLQSSSVVFISLAGNDYAAYTARNGTAEGLQAFIPVVVNQLTANIRRLQGLGARKIIVTNLEPLGCLPRMTQTTSFQQCNVTQNMAVSFHNFLLQQAVEKLNNQTKDSSVFILDLYASFTSVLDHKGNSLGNIRFDSPFKPCCMGMNSAYSCGAVDDKGAKMYTVCSNPKTAFFWDTVHPTEAGWQAVYKTLHPNLEQFFKIN